MLNQKTQADTEIKTTTITLPVDGLFMAIAERGLTVDRIARIGVDLKDGKVLLTYTDASITVEGKRHFMLPRTKYPTFRTWFKVNSAFYYEIEGTETENKSFDLVAKQLEGVKDHKGNLVTGIYFIGSDARDCKQFVVAGGKTTYFAKKGDTNVAGIRYDYRIKRLYALLYKRGVGVKLLVRDTETQKTHHDLVNPMEWEEIGSTIEPGILSLSRPMVKGDDTIFVANMPNNMVTIVTVKFNNDKPVLIWGKPQKANLIVLGKLFGQTDINIGYRLGDNEIDVIFEKSADFLPIVV
ncbi:MAG: hypothetical protein ABIB04_03570 [Patescibacteria group bacterium]